MTDDDISNPHDRFVKLTFGQIPTARNFFAQHLPAEVVQELDLESLELSKDSFIDVQLKGSYSDLVFTARLTSNADLVVYVLFEHKSRPDRMTPFQLLR